MSNADAVLNFQPGIDQLQRSEFVVDEKKPSSIEISVVIPTYRAEDCLVPLHKRLTDALSSLTDSYEIIFIEDCGPDQSWDVLTRIAKDDVNVSAYKLSKNFGQQMAITAGLSKATGNWVVVMDCDLQEPPEFIEKLYKTAQEGYDIVFASRKQRATSAGRRFASKLYFTALNVFQQTNTSGDYGAFTIISRKVRDAFLEFSDVNRHYVMILMWLGFDSTEIEYEQADRYSGESSYSLRSLVRLAIEGVFFRTTVLLKAIVCLGFVVSMIGVCFALWATIEYFTQGALPGWTSLTVAVLLLSGLSLVSQGIVGLYVGEIFDQVKRRPLFLIAKQCTSRKRLDF
jgi:glycosyltransferase involved in cell wall biosynthesis